MIPFYLDDPGQRLLYIGGCSSRPGLERLLSDIETGRAPAEGFYTANLAVPPQDWMTQSDIAQLGSYIDSLAPYVAQGRVRWVTLTEMADLWRTQYGSRPSRYDCAAGTATPTPTLAPTPAPAVGGFTDLPAVTESPATARDGRSFGYVPAALFLGMGAAALGMGVWYARRRRSR